MKRILLVSTIVTTLAAAAIGSSLIAGNSPGSNERVSPNATAEPEGGKAVADGNGSQQTAPLLAESGRPPVPIVRKPAIPMPTERVAPQPNGDTTDAKDVISTDRKLAEPAPDPRSGNEGALPYANGDFRQTERFRDDPRPMPYPDYWVGRGEALRGDRIIISRGTERDVVVIPVDRHMVVIQGYRFERDWKRKKGKRDRD